MADAKVNVVVTGDKRASNALKGVTGRSRASAKEQEKTARKLAATETALERTKHQRIGRFRKDALKKVRQASREQERLSRKLASAKIRDAERASKAAVRAQEKATAAADRASKRRFTGVGAGMAGAALGAATGAVQTAQRFRSIGGIKSKDQEIQDAVDFDIGVVRLGAQANLSKEEQGELRTQIAATSSSKGIDQNEILKGLAAAQSGFGRAGFDRAVGSMDEMATIAAAMNVPIESVIKTLGTFGQQFELSADDIKLLGADIAGAAQQGAIEWAGFANAFQGEIGGFAQVNSTKGLQGAREFVALSQSIGAGQFGEAESATRLRGSIASIAGPSREGLVEFLKKEESTKAVGQQLDKGKVNVLAIIKALASRKDFSGVKPNELFADVRGRSGIMTAVEQERMAGGKGSSAAASNIMSLNTEAGQALIDKQFSAVSDTAGFKFAQQQAESQAKVTENLGEYTDVIIKTNELTNKLNEELGAFSLALPIATGALQGMALAAGIKGLAGGATGLLGGGAAAGGSALLAGGMSAGAATAAAVAGTVAAAGAVGVGAGVAASYALEGSELEKLMEGLGASLAEATGQGGGAMRRNDVKITTRQLRVAEQQLAETRKQSRIQDTDVKDRDAKAKGKPSRPGARGK